MLNKILRRRKMLVLSALLMTLGLFWGGYELMHLSPSMQTIEKTYTFLQFQESMQRDLSQESKGHADPENHKD